MGLLYPRLTVLTLAYSGASDQGFNSSALSISDSTGSAVAIAIAGIAVASLGGGSAAFPVVFLFGIALVLLAAVLLLVGSGRGEAMDYGHVGQTFPVIEPDLLSMIEARLRGAEASGELAQMNEVFAKRVEQRVRRPKPVEGITPARIARNWDYDPTIAVERDIRDQKGNLIAAAGHRINPLDFVGINYYTRSVTRDDPRALPVRAAPVRQPQHAYTETGWEVYPPALTRTLLWVTERYGRLPLYVTENGAAFYDPPHAIDGRVQDPLRIHYYREHLAAVHDAIQQGADVRGYFAWSLLDNFEWSLGYSKRFGIVHVNYETLERTVKDSGRFYAGVIAANAVE